MSGPISIESPTTQVASIMESSNTRHHRGTTTISITSLNNRSKPTSKPPIAHNPISSPPSVSHHLHPHPTTMKTHPVPQIARLPSLSNLRPPTTTTSSPPLQGQASNAAPMPPQSAGDVPPNPRELAARLALLLHARECCTPFDRERMCGVRNCRVARGVLDHCQECFLSNGQCHRSCSEAKQLLRHFRICKAQNFSRSCQICDVLRTDFAWAMEHARSLTPLFQDGPSERQQNQQQQQHAGPAAAFRNSLSPTALRRSVTEAVDQHSRKRGPQLPTPQGTSYVPPPAKRQARCPPGTP